MPDSFQVEFAPSFPLSIWNALSVRAKRFHAGLPKTEWGFNLGPDGFGKGLKSSDLIMNSAPV